MTADGLTAALTAGKVTAAVNARLTKEGLKYTASAPTVTASPAEATVSFKTNPTSATTHADVTVSATLSGSGNMWCML
jgi:hypothetical protein